MTPNESQLVKRLIKLATKRHYWCEDSWYSCPKDADGCTNEANGTDCDCGADKINEEVDNITKELGLL
jgi:hypothetical protein